MILNKIEEIFDDLNSREQKLIAATVVGVIFFIIFIFAFLVSDSFGEREDRIYELKTTVAKLMKNRYKVEKSKEILAAYEMKALKKPPMLQGYIDKIASKFEFSPNYNPKKPADLGPHGEYHKESVETKLYDVDLKKLAQFMMQIEHGSYLIMITELKITTRRNQHDHLDAVMTVSSFYKRSAQELKKFKKNKKNKDKKGK